MTHNRHKRLLLWCIAIIAVVSVGQMPPVNQDLSYHVFADTRSVFGIPNSANVLSNLPFLLVGLYGLQYVVGNRQRLKSLYWGALTFAMGVTLVAVGSGYYHWMPANETLVWDRLPMTIAFMGLYAMIISAFVHADYGSRLLPWLVVAGFVSVLYWIMTEAAGQGDLRWYALVQFLPMLLTLVILLMFESDQFNKRNLIIVLIWYFVAKLLEFGDLSVMTITGVISGHSLKHIAAAIASFYVIRWLKATKVNTGLNSQ